MQMPRAIASLLLACLGIAPAFSAQPPSDRFVLCQDDCMIVDDKGATVTKRRFEKVEPFQDGLTTFTRKQKVGVIDRQGQTILKPRHDGVTIFEHVLLADRKRAKTGDYLYKIYGRDGRLLSRLNAPELFFKVWNGRLYYHDFCQMNDRASDCRFVFLDEKARPIARFNFFAAGQDHFAQARDQSGLAGYVDSTLRFVIPPVFLHAQPFKRDLAAVATPDGDNATIDRSGRIVIPPGRYQSVFLSDSAQLVTAFAAGQPNCQILVRPDGSELQLPLGICGNTAYSLEPYGYALVRGKKSRLFGTVDAAGRTGVPPIYTYLTPYNEKYLVFADAPDRAKNYGLVGIDGRVVLPLLNARIESYADSIYRRPGELRDLLIARTDDGVGLIDFNGMWRVPPRYYAIKVLTPDLLALESDGGSVTIFADGSGKMLPLVSSYIGIPSKLTGTFRISRCDRTAGDYHCSYGLADRTGKVVLAPRFTGIEEKEEGLFHVRIQEGYRTLWGVYDSRGNEVIAPLFTELDRSAGLQAVVASDRDHHPVLIDERGKVLARYLPESSRQGRE